MTDGGTDWERLRNMSEEEIYANALADPDNPPMETMRNPVITRMRDVPGDTLAGKYRNLRERRLRGLVQG